MNLKLYGYNVLKEQFIKWEPTSDLAGSYCFQSLIGTEDGEYVIVLADKNNEGRLLEITPGGFALSYRKTAISLIDEKNQWPFFEVINSTFLQFLVEESFGFFEAKHFHHFAFLATDATIEIVCGREPSIKVVSKKSLSD